MEDYRQLQLVCPRHQNYMITHGCSFLECKRDPLFCSQCLFDQLDHANEHRQFIFPLPRFIVELFNNMQQVKETVKQYEEVHLNRSSHQKFYHRFMNEQKEHLTGGIDESVSVFVQQAQALKNDVVAQLDAVENSLEDHYTQLADVFDNSELMNLNANHHMELANKIENMPGQQSVQYITQLKHSMQIMKDTNNHNTKNMHKLVQNIQGFKKKQESIAKVDLQQVLHKYLKTMMTEMEQRLVKYIDEVVVPTNQPPQNISINPDLSRSIVSNQGDYPNNSQVLNYTQNTNNKYNQYQNTPAPQPPSQLNNSYQQTVYKPFLKESPKNMNNTSLQAPKNMNNTSTSLLNTSQHNQQSTFNKYQNNQNRGINRHKTASLSQDPRGKNIQLSLENLFEVEENTSALSVIQLKANIMAVGCKDGSVKIFDYQNNNLKLLTIYQYKHNDQGVWSMVRLSTNNTRYVLFGAGQEDGNIMVWQYDQSCVGSMQQNPIMVLQGKHQMEIVTSLLDLGQSLLVAGDSNGLLMVWNYMSGQLEHKFTVHQGQINSLLQYKEGFVAGGYDGQVSVWHRQGGKVSMAKLWQNNNFIYGLAIHQDSLFILDNEKKVKVLDLLAYQYTQHSARIFANESILDILVLQHGHSYSLAVFGKTQLALLDPSLEVLQFYNNTDMYNNNIGFTMNTCNKAIVLHDQQGAPLLHFAIIDQSNQTSRILSVFTLQG